MKSFIKSWLLISIVIISTLTACDDIEFVWPTPVNNNDAGDQPESEPEEPSEPSEPSEPEPPASIGEFRGKIGFSCILAFRRLNRSKK